MSLSLRIISRLLGVFEALFRPSKARPPLIDASPTMATTLRRGDSCLSCDATAMPSAAEMEFEAWPAEKVSYSLSAGLGKPLRPPNLRLVAKASRRPVSSLWPYAWCPHVPHKAVVGGVEYIVKGHGQLHGTHARGKMPRVLRQRMYEEVAELGAQLGQLLGGETAQVGRTVDTGQQGAACKSRCCTHFFTYFLYIGTKMIMAEATMTKAI